MATVREAVAELRADGARLPGDLKRAERQFERAGLRFGRKVGRGLQRGFGALKKLGGFAATAGGLGGILGFGAGLNEAIAFGDQMQRMGSQARLSAAETDKFANTITKVSKRTGIGRQQLAAALDEMVNLEGGTALTARNLETLATGMQGTGTAGADLANVMFTLAANMGVTQEQMRGVLGGIDAIGAKASIPFKQLATAYVEVAAAASRFGDVGPDSVFATVAAMQAMRKEIPSADEIKTSFTNLADELLKKRKQLKKKFKIDVVDDQGNALSLLETINRLEAANLSDSDIADLFGKRAAKGLQALIKNFDQYRELVDEGRRGANTDFLGIRAMERASSRAGKLETALNNAKVAFAGAFTPELIENVATAVDGVASGINTVINALNDLRNIGKGDAASDVLEGADPRNILPKENPNIGLTGFQNFVRGTQGLLGLEQDAFTDADKPLAPIIKNAKGRLTNPPLVIDQPEPGRRRTSSAFESPLVKPPDKRDMRDAFRDALRDFFGKGPLKVEEQRRPRAPITGTRPAE